MTADTSQNREPDEADTSEAARLIAAIECVKQPLCVSAGCRRFGNSPRPAPTVGIIDISQVQSGWIAHGEVRNVCCELCGMIYAEIVNYIPIECAMFPCPACGGDSQLTPEVLSITRNDSDTILSRRLSAPVAPKSDASGSSFEDFLELQESRSAQLESRSRLSPKRSSCPESRRSPGSGGPSVSSRTPPRRGR